ncbi:SPFH domain-containing protein [Corynebacterium sp. YIM 101645]|uniref:SPFH domain-containing protein n=1 Tax=Corynebacterium lemuris TaxID=1859292 RepID=A0ABT2FWN1_9CORY|nr:SPFH domain-containing protein [Corynebacterium lemuris]MCS5479641.1 SPFH domain-containing protein [Corynebacterium lemuris]
MPTTTTTIEAAGSPGSEVDFAERPARTAGPRRAGIVIVLAVLILLGSIGRIIWGLQLGDTIRVVHGMVGLVITSVLAATVRVTAHGDAQVVRFFGHYLGTSRRTGMSLLPPLTWSTKVSVRERELTTGQVEVNGIDGDVVRARADITWRVADTARATFAVDDAEGFLCSRAETALRQVVAALPRAELSRGLADTLSARVAAAGLVVISAEVSVLSTSPGTTRVVEVTLDRLAAEQLLELAPGRREALVAEVVAELRE